MGAKKLSTVPPEKLEMYEKLIATVPGIQRKGDTNPYTSCNGHMFTHLTPEGILAIRLPEAEIDPFLKKYKTTRQVAYGIIRKEYVVVPDGLLKKTSELSAYLKLSFDYVKKLKPKVKVGG